MSVKSIWRDALESIKDGRARNLLTGDCYLESIEDGIATIRASSTEVIKLIKNSYYSDVQQDTN